MKKSILVVSVIMAMCLILPACSAEIRPFPFGITAQTHPEGADMDAACRAEFGEDSSIADWVDILRYYKKENSLDRFFTNLKLTPYGTKSWRELGAFISYRGIDFYKNSRRHFFITRHDGNKPGHYLPHDTINDRELDVGSWTGSGHVLCMK